MASLMMPHPLMTQVSDVLVKSVCPGTTAVTAVLWAVRLGQSNVFTLLLPRCEKSDILVLLLTTSDTNILAAASIP